MLLEFGLEVHNALLHLVLKHTDFTKKVLVIHSLSVLLYCGLVALPLLPVLSSLFSQLLVSFLIETDLVHEVAEVTTSCIEHVSGLLLSHPLVPKRLGLLPLQALEPVLHGFVL